MPIPQTDRESNHDTNHDFDRIGTIVCAYALSRADDPPAEKIRDQQGLTGAAITVRVKNSSTVYHIEHAIIKSLAGQSFITGNLLLLRDATGQRRPEAECRVWIPLNEIQAMQEFKTDPFGKPPVQNQVVKPES